MIIQNLNISFYILLQTSYSTASALYHLAKNPDKQQKLFQEIHRYLPDKDQPVTSNILNELKYLKACIKESMRYHQNKQTNKQTKITQISPISPALLKKIIFAHLLKE
jgi:cytochrome P450